MDNRSVLLIEDERDIAQLLEVNLAECCDEVVIARNGHEGMRAAEKRQWGLIILDLGLPGIGGLEICRRLQSRTRYSPVLMLTAKSSEQERVQGLDAGADDYVTKPFCLQELLARVNAIFRRCEALRGNVRPARDALLRHRELCIDVTSRQVSLGGRQVTLTAREFDLLVHFVRNPERVYTRAQLLDQVWGHCHQGYEHTVNSHINRLRAKIESNPAKPEYIVTVWAVGYRLG